MAALKSFTPSISKFTPLHRLLAIKANQYRGESGQDYCPFSLEAEILARKETLAVHQLNAVIRWEKTFANYEAQGLGGMVPPPPKVKEPEVFTLQRPSRVNFVIHF